MWDKRWRRLAGAAGLLVCGLCGGTWAADGISGRVGDAAPSRLFGVAHGLDPLHPVESARLRSFYEARSGAVWLQADGTIKPEARILYGILAAADQEGLDPTDYHVAALAARLDAVQGGAALGSVAQGEVEVLLTDGLLSYVGDLHRGRMAPKAVSSEFALEPPTFNALRAALQVQASPDIAAALAALAPAHPDYPGLREGLKQMRALQKAGGWPRVVVPASTYKLEPGGTDAVVVPSMRRRLVATGELDAVFAEGVVYDAPLQAAVELFQQRNGLLVDGVVGSRTLETLNASPADRITTLIANMERLRWLPADFGPKYVLVNIPDFSLRAVEPGQPDKIMKVIVGTKVRRTPIFASKITSLIFNPTWTVPVKLAREDWLPKLRKDPAHLTDLGMALYDGWNSDSQPVNLAEVNWSDPAVDIGRYRISQAPGPHNSLGQVKFNIPNGFDVYLHDTPHREKFDRSSRSFSSGCVRVGDPMGLMAFVMEGMADWPLERRKEALAKGATRTVSLRSPVPVYLLYQTAWRDAAGVLQFREDIYDRDVQLLKVVQKAHEPVVSKHKDSSGGAVKASTPGRKLPAASGAIPVSAPVSALSPVPVPERGARADLGSVPE